MTPLAAAIALIAYWLIGAAYISWRSQRVGKDLSPMGLLRDLNEAAERRVEISTLPVAVIVAFVAAAYAVLLSLWPYYAARRLAIHLRIVKGTR
ncbi:hypothetical protein ACIOWI_29580 [Streptomyces sp. NPDC087659]|uniref:hypothetical protein n=1 Tax=Streptomyces sp. NPDC087659 TaxID=3365801 RepID=UPI003821EC20